jgi:hypothetical protein
MVISALKRPAAIWISSEEPHRPVVVAGGWRSGWCAELRIPVAYLWRASVVERWGQVSRMVSRVVSCVIGEVACKSGSCVRRVSAMRVRSRRAASRGTWPDVGGRGVGLVGRSIVVWGRDGSI